jgi:hypothetical protein
LKGGRHSVIEQSGNLVIEPPVQARLKLKFTRLPACSTIPPL